MIIRSLLKRSLRIYQRFLSNRFPFKSFRCTFHQSETCSHYAYRLLHSELPVTRIVTLVRQRLRRCEESSIYQTDLGLVWGPHYDLSLQQSAQVLSSAWELAETRQNLLAANYLVQKYRRSQQAVLSGRKWNCFVLLRSHKAFKKSIAYKLALRCGLTVLLFFVLLPLGLGTAYLGLLLGAVFTLNCARIQWRHWSRFKQIEAASYYRIE